MEIFTLNKGRKLYQIHGKNIFQTLNGGFVSEKLPLYDI